LAAADRRVRDKREGSVLVLAIFREIEMDATDQVPGRIARLEELLDGKPGRGEQSQDRINSKGMAMVMPVSRRTAC
jgi:hypothetical protein